MRCFLIFLLSFAALAVPTTSWEASTSANLTVNVTAASSSSCPQGTAYPDGCSAAPAGTPQIPTLFSAALAPHTEAYAVRPPWNVAGVDYYVGVPTGTVLKDPRSGSIGSPAGCATYSSSSLTVTINSSGCTLNGYNFCNPPTTTAGGTTGIIGIGIQASVANFTIENSYFCENGNNGGASIEFHDGGGLITANEFNGLVYTANNPADIGSDSQAYANYTGTPTGGVVIQYNYCHNRDFECAYLGNNGTAPYTVGNAVTFQYNLSHNFGLNTIGAHAENIKFCGSGTWSGIVQQYNTSLAADWSQVTRLGEGTLSITDVMGMYDLGCAAIVETSNTFTNNTIIDEGPGTKDLSTGCGYGPACFASYFGGRAAGGRSNVYNTNYIDFSGGVGPYFSWGNGQFGGSGSGTSNTWFSSLTGNVNLTTGNPCNPGSYTNNNGTTVSGGCN